MVAGDRLAVHRDLDQRIAIERELERLAHPRVAAERSALRTLAVADIDGDALVADLDDAVDLEAPVALEAGDVGTRQALDEVELPRAQVGEAHRRVDDRQIDDAVEMDRALVPVFREALEHDAVLRHALDKAERAGAHRPGAEPVARGLRRLGRHDHAGAVGEHREQRREWRRQVEPDCVRIHHIHACHWRQVAAAVGAGHVLVALEAELHCRGVELLAIVESDARAELERERPVLTRPLVSGRQLRNHVQLFIEVEQLVAQRGKHDPADEGSRHRRIEDIRVFRQADAQGLALRRANEE